MRPLRLASDGAAARAAHGAADAADAARDRSGGREGDGARWEKTVEKTAITRGMCKPALQVAQVANGKNILIMLDVEYWGAKSGQIVPIFCVELKYVLNENLGNL